MGSSAKQGAAEDKRFSEESFQSALILKQDVIFCSLLVMKQHVQSFAETSEM